MMIADAVEPKTEFDALWVGQNTDVSRRAGTSCLRIFSRSMKTNGLPNDEMPALMAKSISQPHSTLLPDVGVIAPAYTITTPRRIASSDLRHRSVVERKDDQR